MKVYKLITLILLLGYMNIGYCDKLIKVYSINPFTGEKQKEASYLREVLAQKNDLYTVQDFYLSGLKRSFPYKLVGKDNIDLDSNLFIEGDYTELYENGNKKYHFFTKDNLQQGLATTWYENGVKKSQFYLVDNKMEGVYIAWDTDGIKKFSGTISNDMPIGIWTSWDKEGNKTSENYWDSLGKKYKRLEFDKQGNIIKEIKFEDDNKSSEIDK